jgi:uncharacterized membrane protein (UPF0127 family)
MRRVITAAATILAATAGQGATVGQTDAVRYGRVILPQGTTLQVELADTPARRQLGYMFREAVGPEDGMLLLFDDEGFHSLWMKNVTFTLDILWMAGDGRVVDVSPGTPPCREDPCAHYLPMARARYVLELAGGRAAELGIGTGDVVELMIPPGSPPSKP